MNKKPYYDKMNKKPYIVSAQTFYELNNLLDEMIKNDEKVIVYDNMTIYNESIEINPFEEIDTFKIIRRKTNE